MTLPEQLVIVEDGGSGVGRKKKGVVRRRRRRNGRTGGRTASVQYSVAVYSAPGLGGRLHCVIYTYMIKVTIR